VNQTTMLATETQEITEYLRDIMLEKYGETDIKNHIADTRDTLCYATNDNQTSTLGLMEESADLAIVVGGYNSSNTTHLVELLEQKFTTLFIRSEHQIGEEGSVNSFDIHRKVEELHKNSIPLDATKPLKLIITSGASCPDAVVDRVIQKIIALREENISVEEALDAFLTL
jgi:4-hydroxy-3-methylbut-2-enyl diphosphate reductase